MRSTRPFETSLAGEVYRIPFEGADEKFPGREGLGSKAYKLMRITRRGLSIPPNADGSKMRGREPTVARLHGYYELLVESAKVGLLANVGWSEPVGEPFHDVVVPDPERKARGAQHGFEQIAQRMRHHRHMVVDQDDLAAWPNYPESFGKRSFSHRRGLFVQEEENDDLIVD